MPPQAPEFAPDDFWPPCERGPLQREYGATFWVVAIENHPGIYGRVEELSRDLDELLRGLDPPAGMNAVIMEYNARRRNPFIVYRWDGWRWVKEGQ